MKKCIYARCKHEIPDDAAFCPYCGRKQERKKTRRTYRAKGSGSIYKLPGKRQKPWYAVYNGKSTGRTYATKEEAAAALEAAIATKHPELYNCTLEEVYEAWADVAYRDMGVSAKRGYKLAWQYIPQELRTRLARDIRSDDVQEVIDGMQQRGMSDSSANHVKFLYSKLCNWMMQRDLINKNYAQFVAVKKTEHRPVKLFTPEEVAKINALANQPPTNRSVQAAMLVMIYLFTGMRISELFLLRTDAVHLDAKVPYIQGGLKTEAGRDRIIPIYPRVLPFFQFFKEHASGELLISGYSGRHTANGWRSKDYADMLAQLGVPYRVPHNTRKTMATNAAQAGVDQIALAKLMGWSDIDVGVHYYIAPDAVYLAEEMDKLDAWDKLLDNR